MLDAPGISRQAEQQRGNAVKVPPYVPFSDLRASFADLREGEAVTIRQQPSYMILELERESGEGRRSIDRRDRSSVG